jgi:MtN3 and saliva related transmembrane protein
MCVPLAGLPILGWNTSAAAGFSKRALTRAETERLQSMDGWTVTLIGLAAAICTTASYVPQVRKAWETRETDDLSLGMLVTLALGLSFWCLYGFARADPVIVLANGTSLALDLTLVYWKVAGLSRR